MLLARVLRGQKKKCGANFDLRDDDDSSLITEGPFNNYVNKMTGGGSEKCLFLSTLSLK